MKRAILIGTLFIALCHLSFAQGLLTLVDSLQLPQASIWGGISWNGQSISITTTNIVNNRPHLFLRKLDTNLVQLGGLVQLTSDIDAPLQKWLTDHKQLFLNDQHFITFSVAGDSDLYIFKVDNDGRRLGPIVPVVEGTANRTNDMFLTTDGQVLWVGYFKPPSQTVFQKFDQDLKELGQPLITSPALPHNNIGSIVFKDGQFYMFTGNFFGENSNLILTRWNPDWSPAASSPQTLIASSSGDGNWFATGSAYDAATRRWFIAFSHIYPNDPPESEHIDLAVLSETFSLLERQHVTSPKTYRPHLLFRNNFLSMVFDTPGEVFFYRYSVRQVSASPINWKPFFTLAPNEGTAFIVDTLAIDPGGGVPVLNITSEGKIILTSAGGRQLRFFEVRDDGKTYIPLASASRGPDGGFVYLPDGRTRFLTEEPDPTRTPQRHKSRIMSWISSDGINWLREAGIRYQPGAEDDSISSVPSVIQVRDSIWRMYFVGDFYRTNGTRTAISSDWGRTWQKESINNILRRGDVDPHPVYLTDGRIRLYFRTGMNKPPDQAGIAYCESDDGLRFDTLKTKLLIFDQAAPAMLKLDPAVLKLPNGDVVCYIGAAPFVQQSGTPKLIAAWARKTAVSVPQNDAPPLPQTPQLFQNYPNPFNPTTTIRFSLTPSSQWERVSEGRVKVTLKVFDVLGREVATLVDGELNAGEHSVQFNAERLPSGVYFYRLSSKTFIQQKKMVVLR